MKTTARRLLAGIFSLLVATTLLAEDKFFYVPIEQLDLKGADGKTLAKVDGKALAHRLEYGGDSAGAKVFGAAGVEAYMMRNGWICTGEWRFGRILIERPTDFDEFENASALNEPAPEDATGAKPKSIYRQGIWLAIRVKPGHVPAGRMAFPGLMRALDGPNDVPKIKTSNRLLASPTMQIAAGKLARTTFRLKAGAPAHPQAKEAFWKARMAFYDAKRRTGTPGAAWFRYQANLARTELTKLGVTSPVERNPFRQPGDRGSDLAQTFDFFSGGRALSENLQLDRELRIVDDKKGGVAIDSLPGIDVKEIDWKPLVQGKAPKKDALASLIPADQHAVFFGSYNAMRSMIDEVQAQGVPVLGLFTTRSENSHTLDRYTKQLCLPIGAIGKLLGPSMIQSLAFTGSDSYLRTGSDLAVLFEANDATVLSNALRLYQTKARLSAKGVTPVQGELAGIRYTGIRMPNREICAYLAVIGTNVVVSNSLVQLEKIAETATGQKPSLAKLDEFTFFRDRYPLNAKGEGGFLVITDAAIRRWCGARWRIAASRRTRAAAALSELQAVLIDGGEKAGLQKAIAERGLTWLGEVKVQNGQIVSTEFGTLQFLKPISEMNLYYASVNEEREYRRFRDLYQRQWRQFFDPIAIQFTLGAERMAADVTVMPLILDSEYNETRAIVGDKLLPAGAGDPHPEAVLQYLMAVDMKSKPMRELADFGDDFLANLANPFGWIGSWASVYIDDDPIWQKLEASMENDPEEATEFLEDNFPKLPIAFNVEVKSGLRLAAFLTALRATIAVAAPDSVEWQTRKHKDKVYTTLTSEDFDDELNIHYVITKGMLTLSLNEKVIHRVIERSLNPQLDKAKTAVMLPGKSVAVRANKNVLAFLEAGSSETVLEELRSKSFDNLPILNEWKKQGAADPVAFHQRHWNTRLVCPGGGTYRWNEADGTMESTAFGHPKRPKKTLPTTAHPLHLIREVRFGLTFEHGGLRVRGEVLRGKGK